MKAVCLFPADCVPCGGGNVRQEGDQLMVAGARRNVEGGPPVLVLQLKVGTVAN